VDCSDPTNEEATAARVVVARLLANLDAGRRIDIRPNH
jgi:hypothetical protein